MKMVGEKQFRQNYILPSNHSHYTGVEETMKEFKKSNSLKSHISHCEIWSQIGR